MAQLSLDLFLAIILSALIITLSTAHPISKREDIPADWRSLLPDDVYQYSLDNSMPQDKLFEGDIKGVDKTKGSADTASLTVLAQNAVMDRSQLWPNGLVPYTIGSGYNSQQKSVIVGALRDMMSKTCVKFVQRTNERDYITFVNRNSGCSSYVARTGGQQLIDLQEGCVSEFGEVQHEVMHALGFFHEQSRKDRDDYVTIVWSNIQKDNYDQFEKYQSNLLGLTYDYSSIMHYGWNYFAINRQQPTILPKTKAPIGNRKGMSPTDVKKINILYQCSGSASSGSRPSSGSSGSIWDLLSGIGNQGGNTFSPTAPAPAPEQPITSRPAPSRGTSSHGIKDALSSFFHGLLG